MELDGLEEQGEGLEHDEHAHEVVDALDVTSTAGPVPGIGHQHPDPNARALPRLVRVRLPDCFIMLQHVV